MTDLHDKEEDFAHALLHNPPPRTHMQELVYTLDELGEARKRARSLNPDTPPPDGSTHDALPTRALPSDSAERKTYPMMTGLLDYFPDALAEVAHVSYLGNLKHNPGEPLHWARGKSMDHADCAVRHLVERGTRDADNVRHSAQAAWRALANLQQELEDELLLPLPRGAANF